MKRILLISTMAIATLQTFGQTSSSVDSKKFRFGVFLAPTIAWMRPTTDITDDKQFKPENNGSKVGFNYGLMAEYQFQDNYAIVTGLQINMAGGKILTNYAGTETSNVVKSADYNYRLNYLEIPLGLKLRTDPISGFRFFGQLGITTGVNIAKKAGYDVTYLDEAGTEKSISGTNEKIKGTLAIAPVMFTMNIGGGAEYLINDKLAAYFGLFFNNGFAPDATNPNRYSLPNNLGFRDGNTRLNNFAIRVGLFF